MHFFIDHTTLSVQNQAQSYGPDPSAPTTLYNVTSRFQPTVISKAFSCQAGQIVVLQSNAASDGSLVNVILKPDQHLSIPYQNVQYYIYRGLLKSSFFDSNLNILSDASTDLIEAVLNMTPSSDSYPASVVGYDSGTLPGNNSIETIFTNSTGDIKPFSVQEGNYFGNFGTNEIGFEIIIEADKINVSIDYVRAAKTTITTDSLTGLPLQARKEQILAYVDPAAFIGLHAVEGVSITTYTAGDRTDAKLKGADLNALINFFYTKNRIYIDIRSEKGYSYNFYKNYGDSSGNNIKLSGTAQVYSTSNWPIIYQTVSQHANISVNFRIDDNTAPVLYMQSQTAKLLNEQTNLVDDKNSHFVTIKSDPNPSNANWSLPVVLTTPASIMFAYYIKAYYYRNTYNPNSPPSILKNIKYYDSAFCPVDLYNLGIGGLPTNSAINSNANFIREPLQKNSGTGNFGYAANNGAYWDSSRIIFYSKLISRKKSSGKIFLPTYRQALSKIGNHNFDPQVDVICRSYLKSKGGSPIKILGINNYSISQTSNELINDKEILLLLGLTIDELNALKTAVGLNSNHHIYIYLQLTVGNPLTDLTLNDQGIPNGNRFYEYNVQLQGLDDNGNQKFITPDDPTNPGSPILVYTRDQLFFHSPGFSVGETITKGINQIEFHTFSDGNVKINDNIDFGLVYDTPQHVYYKYNDLATNNGLVDIYNGQIVLASEVKRKPTANKGFLPSNPDPDGNVYTTLVHNYRPGVGQVEITKSAANGDILAEGANAGAESWQLFLYQGRITYMVYFPGILIPTLGINFGYNGSTQRSYARPELAAALIGAFADAKLTIVSAGLANIDGTCFPSAQHVDGEAIDTRYMNLDYTSSDITKDLQFITSLHKFGFCYFLMGPQRVNLHNALLADPILEAFVDKKLDPGHNSHLHSSKLKIVNTGEKQL